MDQLEIKALLERVASRGLPGGRGSDGAETGAFPGFGICQGGPAPGVRQGIAEVIYGAGKTPEQIRAIAASMREDGDKTILITVCPRKPRSWWGRSCPLAYHEMGRGSALWAPCRSPRARAASLWPQEVPAICLWRRRR